ncbi:MAG: beta-N-acetylhexosaminidase [Paludibacter sp.]
MKKLLLPVILSLIIFQMTAQIKSAGSVQIIPQPNKITMSKGVFLLINETKIQFRGGEEAKPIAAKLAAMLSRSSGYQYAVSSSSAAKSAIVFQLEKKATANDEAYTVSVKPRQIIVTASSAHGLFNGLQTVRQLFPAAIESENATPTNWTIPCAQIEDAPRYAYRGLHLDVSRHFFDKKFILKYIDMMAMYKYNTFHWHLTDDQGWRIQIKKYPLLTKVSAFRKECAGDTTGGFYTQEDVKEVVAYAAERFVEVIPEIEMPGHAVAVLAAYPELSCSGGPFTVASTWGIFHDVYCAGNEKTYDFIEGVLDEVIPLFPSKYIHVGGDECKKTRWERCMKCQAKMKAENLENEHKLQSYFINRIEKYLQPKGKQIIGWDEILEGGVTQTATIMSWRGINGGIEAAQHGNDVVMTPGTHCYFDHYQGVDNEEPKAHPYGGFLPLQKVYTFDPRPKELSAEQAKHILGGQANVWSEFITTTAQVEYMVYPRALAMIECLWTMPEKKDYPFFEQKVHGQYERMSRYGMNFSKSADRQSTIDKFNSIKK